MTSTDHRGYLLAELRCAALRAKLWQADIEAVGLALKAGLVEPHRSGIRVYYHLTRRGEELIALFERIY